MIKIERLVSILVTLLNKDIVSADAFMSRPN